MFAVKSQAETGQATGFNPVGFIELATEPGRLEEYRRISAFNRAMGVDVQEVSAHEVESLFPLCRTDDVLAGFYVEVCVHKITIPQCFWSFSFGRSAVVESLAVVYFLFLHPYLGDDAVFNSIAPAKRMMEGSTQLTPVLLYQKAPRCTGPKLLRVFAWRA